jgi:phosphate uptake regulator
MGASFIIISVLYSKGEAMYQRSVQVTGGTTFFVTLPKSWATEMGVEAQSTVTLIPTDSGGLLLLPERRPEVNACELKLEEWTYERVQRELFARYIMGYDVIRVLGDPIGPEKRRMVREIAQSLVGLEILEETQDLVVLTSVLKTEDFPAHRSLERVFDMALSMLSDAVSAFATRDEELARDVVERDSDVDRLVLLVERQFSLFLRDLAILDGAQLTKIQFLYYHNVAKQLERVADHAAKISQATLALSASLEGELPEQLRAAAKASQAVLTEAMRSFLDRDSEAANEVLAQRQGEGDELFEMELVRAPELPADDARPLSIALDSCLRIREYAYNIAECALDVVVPEACAAPVVDVT